MMDKPYKYFDRTLTFITNNSNILWMILAGALAAGNVAQMGLIEQKAPVEAAVLKPIVSEKETVTIVKEHKPHTHPNVEHAHPEYEQRFKNLEQWHY